MKKVTIYLDEALWRTFRIRCLEQEISASQQIMQFIHQYVTQPPPTALSGEQKRAHPDGLS